MRRIPIIPTILVLAAAAVMIWLGFWQLDRLRQKEALLARYGGAHGQAQPVPWPKGSSVASLDLYRRSQLLCLRVVSQRGVAGRSARGEAGLAQYARCALPDGSQADVVAGWARDPNVHGTWQGGPVRGVIAPGPRLVADPPLGGLEANAMPDPSEIPNNHLAYAVQWFLFAATAIVIYGVALRRRLIAPSR